MILEAGFGLRLESVLEGVEEHENKQNKHAKIFSKIS